MLRRAAVLVFLVTFAVYGGLGGALFLLPVELQQVAGYSPLRFSPFLCR